MNSCNIVFYQIGVILPIVLQFQTFLYIINFASFTNNIKFQEPIFQFGCKYVLRYFKTSFHDKSLVKTLMEYIISRKLIGWNINFGSVYLEFYFFEKQLKKYQTFSQESDIPGIYKFYYNWNNSSEAAPNSIYLNLFQRLGLS